VILELDYVFQSVAKARRRYLLYALQSETEWSVTELATKVAAWETDTSEADVPQEEINRMYASLYHSHIPKLVDERVIEFDGERETIHPGEYAEQVLGALAGAGASLDSRQEIHARREMDDEEH
jgi:putative alpha-1,2-mannosidase